jgi:hypothetical protein
MKKIILLVLMLFVFSGVVSAVNCSQLSQNISIDIDEQPYVNEKNDFLAVLPASYRTQSVKCWSYIVKDGQYQQTNPQKTEYSKTFFSTAKATETREYFTAQNGVVNAYFTQKNLVAYTEFVLGVKCVSENTGAMIIGEKCITPYYKELKQVPARGVWAVENMSMLVVITFFVILFIILLGYAFRKGR